MSEDFECASRIKKYIDALNEVKSLQNVTDYGEETVKIVEEILKTVDCFQNEDKKPQEVLYDMEIINLSSMVLKDVASNIKTSAELTIDDFIDNLNVNMVSNDMANKWMKLQGESNRIFPPHLTLSKFVPAESAQVELPPKRSYQKKAREKEPLSQKSQPTKVQLSKMKLTDKPDDKLEIDNVHRLYKVLKEVYKRNNHQPLSYFNFVIDPNSFSKTVENIFNVSFLARDSFISMSVCDNQLLIKPSIRTQTTLETKQTNVETKQMIVWIDFDTWEKLVQNLKIKEPAIQSS